MSEIKGKRIVITGGTSGIGLATARLLLAGGARVLVTGRSSIEQAREQLGPSAIVLLSDAASTQDTEKLFARARSDLGGVDLLFLNAGTTAMAPLGDVSEADYDRLFALNTRGAYFAAQKFIPLMSPGSSMVFTTSVANEMGIPGVSAYAATKAALRSAWDAPRKSRGRSRSWPSKRPTRRVRSYRSTAAHRSSSLKSKGPAGCS
jgi:NAD(P)-dependent dehydrogenase (short-subunit alcohol dehydrogenase family)